MQIKKLTALLLSIFIIMPLVIVPVEAEEVSEQTSAFSAMQTSMGATGTFGSLIADQFGDVADEQMQQGLADYTITDVTIEGSMASVEYSALEPSLIVVSLYDENTDEMLVSGNAFVETVDEPSRVNVPIDANPMPEYFMLKAFIMDLNYNPLSDEYVSSYYTSDIQEVVALSASDFEEEKVLNFDNDDSTNFAVYNDDTITIPYEEGFNIPNTTYSENGVYVFTNANDYFKNLKKGDTISYVYNSEVILIKVKDISVKGDTVTITDDKESEMETFFDYIKIENESNAENLEYDSEGVDEEVELIGINLPPEEDSKESDDSSSKTPNSSGDIDVPNLPTSPAVFTYDMLQKTDLKYTTFKFKIGDGKILAGSDDAEDLKPDQTMKNKNVKLSGEFTIKMNIDCELYYKASWNPVVSAKELKNAYFKFAVDFQYGLKGSVTAKYENGSKEIQKLGKALEWGLGKIKFTPVTGVKIEFQPRFKFGASASATFSFASKNYWGFEWTYGEGINNLSKSPDTGLELKVEGKISVSLDLGPKVSLMNEKLFNVKLTIEPNLTLTAANDIIKTDVVDGSFLPSVKHDCSICIYGDIKFGIDLGISVTVLNMKKMSAEKEITVLEKKIADFHYSLTYKEFSFSPCQHKRYRVDFTAKLDGEKAADRMLYGYVVVRNHNYGPFELGKTDSSGKLTEYLSNGEYLIGFDKNVNSCEALKVNQEKTEFTLERCTMTVKVLSSRNGLPVPKANVEYDTLGIDAGNNKFLANIKNFVRMGVSDENGLCSFYVPNGKGTIQIGQKQKEYKADNEPVEVVIEINADGKKPVVINDDDTDSDDTDSDDTTGGKSGYCGENAQWNLDDKGTLTIWGEGDMYDFTWDTLPWYGYNDYIVRAVIKNGITSIGDWAFYNCSSLTSIEIPNSVTSIGDNAFGLCSSLTSIEIPNSVTSIGDCAFEWCISLTSIEIPNSVTSIGDWAFYNCSGLTSIEIPNSVTSIGEGAFANCWSLTSIEVDFNNKYYSSEDGYLFNKEKNIFIAYPAGKEEKYYLIPNSVTSIGGYAFSGGSSLTSIEIPNSVTSIGDYAFYNCSSLTSIEIPNSVTSIGNEAFYNCHSLTSIEIPNSVTSIGDWAFYNFSSLTSIEIPNSVTSIGNHAFDGCSSLTSIEIPNSVTSIKIFAFSGCSSLKDVYYTGTEEQWKKISIGSYNSSLTSATIHYNSHLPNSSGSSLPTPSTAAITNYLAPIPTNTKTMVVSKSANKEYTGLVANGRYIFMLVKSDKAENLVASDNLVYIDQFTADENGVVTADYPDTYGNKYTALIFGGKAVNDNTDKTPEKTVTYPLGDIDGDGKLTSADSLYILRYSVKLETFDDIQTQLADVDNDGSINSADSLAVLRASVGLYDNPNVGKPKTIKIKAA